jgi:hypothetical protein
MASYSDFASLYFMFLTVIYSPEKDHKKRVWKYFYFGAWPVNYYPIYSTVTVEKTLWILSSVCEVLWQFRVGNNQGLAYELWCRAD